MTEILRRFEQDLVDNYNGRIKGRDYEYNRFYRTLPTEGNTYDDIAIENCNFRNHKWIGKDEDVGGINFYRTTFTNCRFRKVYVEGNELSIIGLYRSDQADRIVTFAFIDCRFLNCKFEDVKFEYCLIKGCTFTACTFDKTDFSNSALIGCDFVNVEFKTLPISRIPYAFRNISITTINPNSETSTTALETIRSVFRVHSQPYMTSKNFDNIIFDDHIIDINTFVEEIEDDTYPYELLGNYDEPLFRNQLESTHQHQGQAFAIHNTFQNIDMGSLTEFLKSKVGIEEFQNNIISEKYNIGNVADKFSEHLLNFFEKQLDKLEKDKQTRDEYNGYANSVVPHILSDKDTFRRLNKTLMLLILAYVEKQTKVFRDTYVKTLLQDSANAYNTDDAINGMGCIKGIYERFVTSIYTACSVSCDETTPPNMCKYEYEDLYEILKPAMPGSYELNHILKKWYKNIVKIPNLSDMSDDKRREHMKDYMLDEIKKKKITLTDSIKRDVQGFVKKQLVDDDSIDMFNEYSLSASPDNDPMWNTKRKGTVPSRRRTDSPRKRSAITRKRSASPRNTTVHRTSRRRTVSRGGGKKKVSRRTVSRKNKRSQRRRS